MEGGEKKSGFMSISLLDANNLISYSGHHKPIRNLPGCREGCIKGHGRVWLGYREVWRGRDII